jgi:hypothetical protein
MPANDGSGRNQNERSPPSGPESLQDNPEQLVQDGQSPARTVSVQRKKLLTQSEIFENEILSGTECNDKPSQEMPERHDYGRNHGSNLIGRPRIKLVPSRSFCECKKF